MIGGAFSRLDRELRRRARIGGPDSVRNGDPSVGLLGADDSFRYHPWPVLVSRERWRRLEADVVAVVGLVAETPRRVFGDDVGAMADFYGVFTPAILRLLLSEPNGLDSIVCRGDFLIAARTENREDSRLLEANFSPNSGGWETGEVARRLLRSPDLASLLTEGGETAEVLDPVRALFDHVIAAGRRHLAGHRRTLDTVLLRPEGGYAYDEHFEERVRRTYREAVEAAGLDGELRSAVAADLGVGRHVRLAGRRVHALVVDLASVPPSVYRVFKARRVAMFNDPLEAILSDKRTVALLSERAAEGSEFTAEERELVRRVVPWTRVWRPELRDRAVEERRDLVLKPARSSGGRGVVLGDQTHPEAWRRQLEAALEAGDWVLQERVQPSPHQAPDLNGELIPWHVVWGIYCMGGRATGVLLRMSPAAEAGVISGSGGALGSTVLLVGDDPSPPTARVSKEGTFPMTEPSLPTSTATSAGPVTYTSVADVPEAVREHHRWLSEADWTFRSLAFERPEMRDPTRFDDVRPFILGESYNISNHPWPTFVSRERWAAVERDVVAVCRLLLETPRRVFEAGPGRGARMAEFYGYYPPQIFDILMAEPDGIDGAACRGDFLVRDGRLHVLELNASTQLGGLEIGHLAERYLENAVVREFLGEHGLEAGAVDPLRELLAHVVAASRRSITDGSVEVTGRLNTVIVHAEGRRPVPEGSPQEERVLRFYRRALADADLEGELLIEPVGAIGVRQGNVEVRGRRIHAMIGNTAQSPPAYRAFKAGRVGIFNGPLEPILSDKRGLALLSEHGESDRFDAREREVIRRVVPWTRVLRSGTTRYEDSEIDLPRLARTDRERWILKPGQGKSGEGVAFGNEVPEQKWSALVDEGLAAGDWVIQERIPPTPLASLAVADGTGHVVPHDVVLGLMVYGHRLSGAMLRHQPSHMGGPINAIRSATPGSWLLID